MKPNPTVLGIVACVALLRAILGTMKVLVARGEDRIPCSETQRSWEWHSYRVDGRRCWAKRHPGKYRPSQLYWPVPEPMPITTPMKPPWEIEYRWVDPNGQTHQE